MGMVTGDPNSKAHCDKAKGTESRSVHEIMTMLPRKLSTAIVCRGRD